MMVRRGVFVCEHGSDVHQMRGRFGQVQDHLTRRRV